MPVSRPTITGGDEALRQKGLALLNAIDAVYDNAGTSAGMKTLLQELVTFLGSMIDYIDGTGHG